MPVLAIPGQRGESRRRGRGPCSALYTETSGRGRQEVKDLCRLPFGHAEDHHGRHTGVHWKRSPAGGDIITKWDDDRPLSAGWPAGELR